MQRILLITGSPLRMKRRLRRLLLRYTRNVRATRQLLSRLEEAARHGRVQSALIQPNVPEPRNSGDWQVRVSYAPGSPDGEVQHA